MFSRKMVRVAACVVWLVVVGVFSQVSYSSVFQMKHEGALTTQTLDLRVLKADGTDPPPVPPHQSIFQVKQNGVLTAQTLDLRVLKTDGTDPPPCPPACKR